jgi:hypothetical protein
MNLKKLEMYLPVNLLGPGPRLMEKRIYRAAVSQRLRNTGIVDDSGLLRYDTALVYWFHICEVRVHK